MASLASLLEDYRNWRGKQEWDIGRDADILSGYDPDLVDFVDKFSGMGTDAGGLVGAIKASHGSPHAFDKFQMSKIGTGEGAQAYGHGLYYAQGFDSPVAKQYRDALSSSELRLKGGGEYDPSNPSHMAAAELMGYGGDRAKAINDIQQSIRELGKIKADWRDKAIQEKQSVIDLISKGNLPELEDVSHGHLYNVSLEWPNAAREASDPLSEHHLLDWDKPMSQQNEAVKNAFTDFASSPEGQAVAEQFWSHKPGMTLKDIPEIADPMGETLYRNIFGTELANKFLMKHGIPGIKYLDQGSRGAGTGTSNYVIFNEDIPKIVSRNGVSLTDLLRR